VSLLQDIEYCKSWVSEKTLSKIAYAINLEPYELLIPEEKIEKPGGKNAALQQTAAVIKAKG